MHHLVMDEREGRVGEDRKENNWREGVCREANRAIQNVGYVYGIRK